MSTPDLPIQCRGENLSEDHSPTKKTKNSARCCKHLPVVLTCLTLVLAFIVKRLGLPPLRSFPDRTVPIPDSLVSIDNEIAYDSEEKWAPDGNVAGLHLMNPARVSFFDNTIKSKLKGPYRVVDLGCGGGLVTNALARLEGYSKLVGVDLSKAGLSYARSKAPNGTVPEFRLASMYETGLEDASFDVVIMSDVLEHLTDLPMMLKEVYRLLRPGGLFLFDTIDRSFFSYFVAIFGAEYVTGIVPKGSHDWGLFIRPSELGDLLGRAKFQDYFYESFGPPIGSVLRLWAFGWGLLSADHLTGGWLVEAPSGPIVSYIGSAQKPEN